MFRIIGVLVILAFAYFLYDSYGYRYVLNDVRSDSSAEMVMGNITATTNIVVYTDYASPASRQLFPVLLNLMASDQDINILIRPVATKSRLSQLATRIALVAKQQNRFMDVHNIFMTANNDFNEIYIERAVNSLNMDYGELKYKALSGSVEKELDKYQREAALLHIKDFPEFFIDHVKMSGSAYTVEQINDIVADLRSGRR